MIKQIWAFTKKMLCVCWPEKLEPILNIIKFLSFKMKES